MTVGYGYPSGLVKLLFDGQSLNYTPADANAYPTVLMGLLPSCYRKDIVGYSATTYAQRSTTAAARCDARIPLVEKSVIIDIAGQSDIAATGGNLTAAQLLTAAEAYADARRTAGVDLYVVCTIPPGTAAWYDADALTQRTTYNTNVKLSSHFDAVCDIAAIPEAADPANTTYYSDGLHPTAALAALIAAKVKVTLGTLGLVTA